MEKNCEAFVQDSRESAEMAKTCTPGKTKNIKKQQARRTGDTVQRRNPTYSRQLGILK